MDPSAISELLTRDDISVSRSVRRYDRGVVRKPRRDDSTGALIVDASVTRAPAVFLYTNADGSVRREFRPAEHVFSARNLDSIGRAQVTIGHPAERVTIRNVKRYSVGHADGNARVHGDHAFVGLVVTDQRGIDTLDAGVVETSLGYDCDLVHQSGVWVDEHGRSHPYDAIQTNHLTNHAAICPRGRAGTTRVHLDELDAEQAGDPMTTPKTAAPSPGDYLKPTGDASRSTVRVSDRLDITVGTAEAKIVADELAAKDARIADADSRADKAEAERDDALAKLKSAEESANAKESETPKLDALVESRLELFAIAQPHFDAAEWDGPDGKREGVKHRSDADIRKAVVAKVHPDLSLDGKSDTYVEAMFDLVGQTKARSDEQRRFVGDALLNGGSRGDARDGVDRRISDAIKRADEAWKYTIPGGATSDGKTRKPELRF